MVTRTRLNVPFIHIMSVLVVLYGTSTISFIWPTPCSRVPLQKAVVPLQKVVVPLQKAVVPLQKAVVPLQKAESLFRRQ